MTVIYILVGIASAVGIGVAIWSFFDTRKKYYTEYTKRNK